MPNFNAELGVTSQNTIWGGNHRKDQKNILTFWLIRIMGKETSREESNNEPAGPSHKGVECMV